MLILTRRIDETITIGIDANTTVTVLGIQGNHVKLGIIAPKDVEVNRQEVYERKHGTSNGLGKRLWDCLRPHHSSSAQTI
ncbi:hypothetical protein BH10PSE19_BH10PSE19_00230 [soil metagenome]